MVSFWVVKSLMGLVGRGMGGLILFFLLFSNYGSIV